MPIEFQCRCGKAYRVADDFAGKRVRCKTCGESLQVPAAKIPAVASLPTPSQVVPKAAAVVPPPEPPPTPIREVPTTPPVKVQISALRYCKLYPIIPIVCLIFATAIIGAGLFVSPYLYAALILPIVVLFWHVKGRVALATATQIEPGVVISSDPPLVATLVDLGLNSQLAWDYLRISSANVPANRKPGERILMAVQRNTHNPGNHLRDFRTQPLADYTENATFHSQAIQTIPEHRWRALVSAWETILQPDTPGLYKVPTKPREGKPIPRKTLETILQQTLGHDPPARRFLSNVSLPPPILQAAQASYAADIHNEDVLALIKCDQDSTGRLSLLFTANALRFKIRDDLSTDVAWSDLWTVGITGDILEIVMITGLRMGLPFKTFEKNAGPVELTLARICELP